MVVKKKPIKRGKKKKASFPTGIVVAVLVVLALGGGGAWFYLNMPSVAKAKQLMAAGDSRQAVEMLEQLESKDDAEARRMLGQYYWFGAGKSLPRDKPLQLAKQLAMNGDTAFAAVVGKHLFRDGNDQLNLEALTYLQPAANAGDGESAELAGRIYLNGWGVLANKEKAVQNLAIAAERGRPYASAVLGRIMLTDGGAPAGSVENGVVHLERAAASDDREAQFIAAKTLYEIGESGKAHPLFLAVLDDIPEANYHLASMHYHGDGAEYDPDKAYAYLKPLENADDPKVKTLLGKMYYHGSGVANDDAKAYQFLKDADDDLEAVTILAMMHIEGRGVRQEMVSGIRLLTKAADGGDPVAQRMLGDFYLNAKYVQFDRQKGLDYITLAANGGDEQAEKILNDYRRRMARSQARDTVSESKEEDFAQAQAIAEQLRAEEERKQRALEEFRSRRTSQLDAKERKEVEKAQELTRSLSTVEEEARLRKEAEARTRRDAKRGSVYKDADKDRRHRATFYNNRR